ncbi:MAG: HU family DNA-binding protein, partial [Bacteroidota bacterium]
MNKQELVDAMAESTGSTKADAKKALDAFIDA